jgi:hypothetical protein
VIGVAIGWAGTAAAGTASFSIAGGAMTGDTGATVSSGGVILPNVSGPRVFFTFVLPRNYVSNTSITIIAYMHSVDADCTFVLLTDTVVQRRPGIEVDGTKTVFVPNNGSTVVTASSSVTIPFKKSFSLNPGGTIATMRKGDQFMIGLVRDASDVEDTCTGDVYFEAVDLRYTTP